MKKPMLSKANFDLWLSIGQISHSITLVRQRELRQHRIPVRQLHFLFAIHDLGSKATLNGVAKERERRVDVISRQAVSMEKDGLIKRIKNTPKSNLISLELTEKGLQMIKIGRKSKSIDGLFSILSAKERQQLESIVNRLSIKLKEYTDA